VIFGLMRVEQFREMRKLQNLPYVFGNVAQFQITMNLAGAGQSADHGPETAAVDEDDFAEMKNDGAAVAQQPGDVRAQRIGFAASDQAAFAADDRNPPYIPCFER
jgi:hypothetical protein